jgi:hypothetical protein
MLAPNEKETTTAGETDSSESPTLNTPVVDNDGDSHSVHRETPAKGMTDDLYPHGLKLVLLASASVCAVFLIALDQVRTSTHLLPTSWQDTLF